MVKRIRPEIGTYFYNSCVLKDDVVAVTTLEETSEIPTKWFASGKLIIVTSPVREMEVNCSGIITIKAPAHETEPLIRQLKRANQQTEEGS